MQFHAWGGSLMLRSFWIVSVMVLSWAAPSYTAGDGERDKPRPSYHGDIPLGDRLDEGGDLRGNIAADRPLSEEDLDYLLELSDYLIDKRNRHFRDGAARILGEFGHKRAIPALLAVIRDPNDNEELRQEAVKALSMIRDKRVVGYLIEDGLGSDSIAVASQASEDLSQFVNAKGSPDFDTQYKGFDLQPPGYDEYAKKHPKEYAKKRREYVRKLRQHAQGIWRVWWKEHRNHVSAKDLYRTDRGTP